MEELRPQGRSERLQVTLPEQRPATQRAPPHVYVSNLPCTPTVVVAGGVNYYRCGSTWYGQAYSGSGPTYVVVNPPAGY